MAAATGRGWRRPRAGCTASRAGAADGEAPRARRKQEVRAPCPEGTHGPGPKWQEASAAGPRSGEGVIFSKKGVVKDTGGTQAADRSANAERHRRPTGPGDHGTGRSPHDLTPP